MRVLTKLDEFIASQPKTSPNQPATKPGVAPGPAPTKTPSPSRPSPIRRDKPSKEGQPKATAEDVVKRFMKELRAQKMNINFDIQTLKDRYDD